MDALFEVEGCQLVGVREFGREVGVSHTMVQKWIKRGLLTAITNGKVRLEEGIEQVRAAGLGKFRQTEESAAGDGGGELARENIRIARSKANILEAEEREYYGKLHQTDDIIAAFEPMVLATKARLEALPAKAAPLMTGDTDTDQETLTRLIREAQKELAGISPAAVKAARRKRGGKIAEDEATAG